MTTHDNDAVLLGSIGLICLVFGFPLAFASLLDLAGLLQGPSPTSSQIVWGIVLTVVGIITIVLSARIINRQERAAIA